MKNHTCFWILILFLTVMLNAQTVRINEIMSSNGTAIMDDEGNYSDWIELYNGSNVTVNLEGYGISDSYELPFKWVFPAVEINQDEYLLLWASGSNRTGYDYNWYENYIQIASGIWLMRETSGTIAEDISANSNNGIIHGVGFSKRKKTAGAMTFDRIANDFIQIENTLSLQITGSQTISMWIKPTSFAERQNPIDKSYDGEGSIVLETNGRLNYFWGIAGTNSGSYQSFAIPRPVALNDWTHLVLVRDMDAMTLHWYINGSEKTTAIAEFEQAVASTNPVRIGSGYAGAFDGSIGETVILPFALSAEQVNELFLSQATDYHTNFGISAEGEEIILTDSEGLRVDEIAPINIPRDVSLGRFPNGADNLVFFDNRLDLENSSPGFSNNNSNWFTLPDSSLNPSFSHQSGFYESSFNLTLSHSNPDAEIYYTLDGSEPDVANLNENGAEYPVDYFFPGESGSHQIINRKNRTFLYTEPINIYNRTVEENDLSEIITTYAYAPGIYEWIRPQEYIFKANVVKAATILDGNKSDIVTNSYFVNEDIQSRYDIPVVSFTTNSKNLFGYDTGIYVPGHSYYDSGATEFNWGDKSNFTYTGYEWERSMQMELFNSEGNLSIAQNVGARIQGGSGRERPQKSFRLYARPEQISYDFFGSQPSNFQRIIFSSGGNLRNLLLNSSANDIMMDSKLGLARTAPIVHFINGEYWGLLNAQDRLDEHFVSPYYGINIDNLVILDVPWGIMTQDEYHITPIGSGELEYGLPGDRELYNEMYSFVVDNDMASSENYDYVKTVLDIDSYLDYHIMFIFFGNLDWNGNKHFKFWRTREEEDTPYGDTKWRMIVWDFDNAFLRPNINLLLDVLDPEGNSHGGIEGFGERRHLFQNLLANHDFKNRFINRFADHLNTLFQTERMNQIISDNYAKIEPYLTEHTARWGHNPAIGIGDYQSWTAGRPNLQRQHIRESFGISDNIQITLSTPNLARGSISVNSVELKPTTEGVAPNPYPWTGLYFADIPIRLKATAEAGYNFTHWSGDTNILSPEQINNTEIEISSQTDFSLTANFILDNTEPQLAYFWLFDNEMPNDTPLETINSSYSLLGNAYIEFQSALAGYPFNAEDPNWRKASMERRNAPTDINYRPEGNNNIDYEQVNMRAIQVKQPFVGDNGENTLIFHLPLTNYSSPVFRFAAKDENAADSLVIDYSANSGQAVWTDAGLSNNYFQLLDNIYQLYEIDFSDIPELVNNPDFKIRIRFSGTNMEADEGNRVTFNNFSLDAIPLLSIDFEEKHSIPIAYLNGNYPNPFNPETTISFTINEPGKTTVSVFNIKGQLIKTLEDSFFTAGNYITVWDGRDANNNTVSSGVYFYRLTVNDKVINTRKCLLLK